MAVVLATREDLRHGHCVRAGEISQASHLIVLAQNRLLRETLTRVLDKTAKGPISHCWELIRELVRTKSWLPWLFGSALPALLAASHPLRFHPPRHVLDTARKRAGGFALRFRPRLV
jgi:hypothetical protein